MQNKIKKMIRESIFDILREDSSSDPGPDPGPDPEAKTKKKNTLPKGTISTKGAFGSGGRPQRFVANAKARADKDPRGLLKDLGISFRPSGSDLDQALDILNQAIHNNSFMSQAYVGANENSSKTVEGEKIDKSIVVTVGELDVKNGVRFLANTLLASKNAGFLNLKGGLQFSQGLSGNIIIYSQ